MTTPPTTTRAAWFSAPRQVEFRDETLALPGPGQVQAVVRASAISHGTEMLVYRGEVDPCLPLDLPTLAGGFGFPIKFGYACVAEITAVGAGVTSLATGDRVFALHPHQSHFCIEADLCRRLPAHLTPELGVFAANTETAINLIHDARINLGETAIVFGQGVVGLLVVQLLKRAGAGQIIVVEPVPARRTLALHVGADVALAPTPTLPEEIRDLNRGRGADLAIEVSGSPAALQAAIACVMPEGNVVVGSWYGHKPVQLNLGGHFHRGRITLRSSQVGRLSPEVTARWDHNRRWEAVLAWLPQLQLAPLISHHIPFARIADAYRLIDEQPEQAVQVVITYN
ncbi:zinc-binding dehydrogenase [Candidatus Chloroploca sp. M-50]|uniref:Zinc-binding dehydrogenase n=1 Tax=Candidatus Chloroploca mongolica TaxID=2528176 RepID=A0ABS4D4P0_9CHLR|nr:zinc-binding dehydrogenase [Candidatus Chloroploca mongolica]